MRRGLYSIVLNSVAVLPNQTLILGPGVPLRTSLRLSTLYHEAEIILCIPFNLVPIHGKVKMFWGARHIIRIFQNMHITSPE